MTSLHDYAQFTAHTAKRGLIRSSSTHVLFEMFLGSYVTAHSSLFENTSSCLGIAFVCIMNKGISRIAFMREIMHALIHQLQIV